MKTLFLLFLFLGATALATVGEPVEVPVEQAQNATDDALEISTSPFHQSVSSSIGIGTKSWTVSAEGSIAYGFGRSRRVALGVGARWSSFFGGNSLVYQTAQSSLLANNQIHLLTVSQAQSHSLNLYVELKYRVWDGVELGMNIDCIGVGFGKQVTGQYAATDPAFGSQQSASVPALNLLLGGRRDKGQLNSQFFVGYHWSEHWGVRAGWSHFVTELTTAQILDDSNDRFRSTTDLVFVSLLYRL